MDRGLDGVLEEITKEVEACSPSIVVVDSFRSVMRFMGAGKGTRRAQEFVQRLALLLTTSRSDDLPDRGVCQARAAKQSSLHRRRWYLLAYSRGGTELRRTQAAGHQAPWTDVRAGVAHLPHHRRRPSSVLATLGLTGKKKKAPDKKRLSTGVPV